MAELAAGRSSFRFSQPPVICAWASAVGKKEGEGPLGRGFDGVFRDSLLGQDSWEQGERALQQTVLRRLLRKAGLSGEELGAVFSGDLLNQCIASSFALRNSGIPHLGLYGACSTMAEGLVLASMAVGGGFLRNAAAMASSHFCSCERQYRFPLGYGGQRTPTSQWTVTGAGALLLAPRGKGPRVRSCTLGTVRDLGLKDANNMGCAMAPAALQTICAHLEDLGREPADYDLIVTGDLGRVGLQMLLELAERRGLQLGGRLQDCGAMIFSEDDRSVRAGGSGAGCSAAVLCSNLLRRLNTGSLKRILFCGTGALLSPLTTQQKLPIPGICHAVAIEAPEEPERKEEPL